MVMHWMIYVPMKHILWMNDALHLVMESELQGNGFVNDGVIQVQFDKRVPSVVKFRQEKQFG